MTFGLSVDEWIAPFFPDQKRPDGKNVNTTSFQRTEGVSRSTDDRLFVHVEAGIDQER